MHSFHDTISSLLHLSLHLLLYLLVFNDSCLFTTSYNIIIIMIGHRNRFIQDVDFSESTSLTHLLNRHTREDDEDVETQMIKHSPFCGQKQFDSGGAPSVITPKANYRYFFVKLGYIGI